MASIATAGYSRGLHLFAALTAVSTFLLIIAGGLVTSNDAGLAVPDWPLSYGKLMPPMVGGIFYEHGHRMIASGVGFMTIILALWTSRVDSRPWVRRIGWVALGAVIAQGLFGGLTVIFQLPVLVSVAHACLAQTFFCLTLTLAVVTSRLWWSSAPVSPVERGAGLKLNTLAVGIVYLQLALGAILRHTGMVGGTKGVRIDPFALSAHLLGALFVLLILGYTVVTVLREGHTGAVSNLARMLGGMLVLQVLVGVGALVVRMGAATRPQPSPGGVGITVSHVAIGAMILGTTLVLCLIQTRLKSADRSHAFGQLAEEAS